MRGDIPLGTIILHLTGEKTLSSDSFPVHVAMRKMQDHMSDTVRWKTSRLGKYNGAAQPKRRVRYLDRNAFNVYFGPG